MKHTTHLARTWMVIGSNLIVNTFCVLCFFDKTLIFCKALVYPTEHKYRFMLRVNQQLSIVPSQVRGSQWFTPLSTTETGYKFQPHSEPHCLKREDKPFLPRFLGQQWIVFPCLIIGSLWLKTFSALSPPPSKRQ